jgi:hypothetical protein
MSANAKLCKSPAMCLTFGAAAACVLQRIEEAKMETLVMEQEEFHV